MWGCGQSWLRGLGADKEKHLPCQQMCGPCLVTRTRLQRGRKGDAGGGTGPRRTRLRADIDSVVP